MITKILRLKNERGDELEVIKRDESITSGVKVVLDRVGPPVSKISDAEFDIDEFKEFIFELYKCFC